ncbi:hypothetical protein Tco_1024765 [Tanacetum coccineum]
MMMEKFEDLVTKIDSELLIIRKEIKEMRDSRRDNHTLDDYLMDDMPMCEPHEANYVQRYHGGYHDHEPINSYSYPNHNSHPSRYFEFTKTSTGEMMREWTASQTKENEHMNNQVDETQPVPTMPNLNQIKANLPTVSPFPKDCTVHIPYMNAKTFADVVLLNHVGEKEFKSIVGNGIRVLTKKKIKKNDMGLLKEPAIEWNMERKIDEWEKSQNLSSK